MDAKDLIKKVRKIEIKTRGLSQNIFAGEYHSAFKGRGMMFSEVREYQYGDDIRDIDWNVTARHNHPYIKVYEEERELTVMLLVDVSGSRYFGAEGQEKREMIAEIAATIAFSASQNNDKIGALFFSDKIEKFIPPQKGKKHILLIIRELLDFKPESRGTDIGAAVRYFADAMKKRCTTFLISDFIDEHDYSKPLAVARNRHDVIALQVYDKRDTQMPDVGLMRVLDLETGSSRWIDTSSSRVRKAYGRWWYDRQQRMAETLRSRRIDFASVATDEDYVRALMGLFKEPRSEITIHRDSMRLIKIIFTAAVALAATIASAQGLKVTAELDSTVMTQGYCTDLRVRVLGTADAHTVDWPKEGGQLAGVDVAKISADTADLGNGRRETTYTLTLQPFDPDTVTLPPLRVACGTDTAETRALVLKVLPVELDSLTTIHPMEGPVAYPAKWYDWVPQWVSDYWPWIIIAIGLIAAAVAAWIYFRRGGTVMVRRKRIVPPYELAMHRLGQLRERRLAESGHEKEYYTELTDILRQYLEGRFGINAMEMTSTEIVRSLRANETTRMSADRMRSVLEVADFVKFAKMRPLPDDNVKSYNAAVAFVEDTRPAPEPDTENGENKTEKAK